MSGLLLCTWIRQRTAQNTNEPPPGQGRGSTGHTVTHSLDTALKPASTTRSSASPTSVRMATRSRRWPTVLDRQRKQLLPGRADLYGRAHLRTDSHPHPPSAETRVVAHLLSPPPSSLPWPALLGDRQPGPRRSPWLPAQSGTCPARARLSALPRITRRWSQLVELVRRSSSPRRRQPGLLCCRHGQEKWS